MNSIKICEGSEYNSNRRTPAIKIGVLDSGGNPIDKPKVIVYDSLHWFVKEEVVNKTDVNEQIKKIEIQNFGTYYLQK